jgi:hypothetical protein
MPVTHEIISREQAAALGRKTFYTGQPCKHGHVAPRYVTNAGCLDCVSKWRKAGAKNPYSHDLVPWMDGPLWRSKRLNDAQTKGLKEFVQRAIDAYCAHFLPPVCKACDGTHYVPVRGSIPPRWEVCEACTSTADVPTGTEAAS